MVTIIRWLLVGAIIGAGTCVLLSGVHTVAKANIVKLETVASIY